MDTILPAILLVIALLLWRAIRRIEQTETRRRTYRADTVQRAVRRHSDVEADALYLWQLRSAGHAASRRAVMRSHEMSAARWNRANRVLDHLRLDVARHSYRDGVGVIQGYCRTQAQLRQAGTFVPPVDQSE